MFTLVNKRNCQDDGSVLLLGIGLALVALMCATVAIDVASAWVARSHLQSVADGAALAGAQEIDTAALYDGVDVNRLPLSRERAGNAVRTYLRRIHAESQFLDFSLRDVTVVHNRIGVIVQARTAMPFGYFLGSTSAEIRVQAQATHLWPSN